MKRILIILALAALLMLVNVVMAMESTSYQLAWFTPMTGSGGKTSSVNYTVEFTVGQSAVGIGSSLNYGSCLGYWCGIPIDNDIYLPLILRSAG